MPEYREHLSELDILQRLAWNEARRLSSPAIASEELLLAILHPEAPSSLAARALRDCGIARNALAADSARKGTEAAIEGDPQLTPSAYRLLGLAEGIAAGAGATAVTAEHLLFAILWEPSSSHSVLERHGSSRELLRARLAELGADLPERQLPPPDPRRWGPRVEVALEDLPILVRELPQVLPEGTGISFNHDRSKAWIAATEGIDLAVHIPRALGRRQPLS